jgi:phage FluMu protein gp41
MSVTSAGEPATTSESVRATTREESEFRISAPNSTPRNILVVALETGAARLLSGIAKEEWRRASFRSSVWLEADGHQDSTELKEWFDVVAGHAEDLADEIAASDIVVMVTTAGDPTTGASVIGEACVARSVKTSGIIIQRPTTSREILTQSLRDLRPWTQTISVIGESDMVVDMIHALGA